jgi:hypothetical protein
MIYYTPIITKKIGAFAEASCYISDNKDGRPRMECKRIGRSEREASDKMKFFLTNGGQEQTEQVESFPPIKQLSTEKS